MTFTYNRDIPNGPNNPSNDQPKMQTNTNSIDDWTAVDHVRFRSSPAGTHLQTTYSSKNVPGAQIDPQSVMYTNNVTAAAFNTASASTVASAYFRNQNEIFPISMLRAFGCFDNTGASLNAWNMVLKAVGGHPSTGNYVMTMPTNCCSSTSYLVICTPQASTSGSKSQVGVAYSITSSSEFNLQFGIANVGFFDPDQFSVIVLQL